MRLEKKKSFPTAVQQPVQSLTIQQLGKICGMLFVVDYTSL